ncbi:MAG: hypothetical protein J6V18_00190 [Bacteroidales bacterium]|nr:hypothetical protein [Bacteroidales bacterium]
MLHRKHTTHFTIGLHLEDNFCLTLHRPTPMVLLQKKTGGWGTGYMKKAFTTLWF